MNCLQLNIFLFLNCGVSFLYVFFPPKKTPLTDATYRLVVLGHKHPADNYKGYGQLGTEQCQLPNY